MTTTPARTVPALPLTGARARACVLGAASDLVAHEVRRLAAPGTRTADLCDVVTRSMHLLGWSSTQVGVALSYGEHHGKFTRDRVTMTITI